MAPKFFLDGEPQDTVINLEHSQQNKINLVLPCRAYGCPLPRCTWYRNGRDITESSTPMKNGEFGFKVSLGLKLEQVTESVKKVLNIIVWQLPTSMDSQQA